MAKPSDATPSRALLWRMAVLWCGACCTGCYTAPLKTACDLPTIEKKLQQRTGKPIGVDKPTCEFVLPPGISLDDGLTEDKAVVIALWNNAAFHELLVDLGIARADLVQAGLLPNPEFVYYWPMGGKPYRYLFDLPIDVLWLRPMRVKSAKQEVARVCDRLVQAGLDLMRDTRQAYADVLLARERLRILEESVQLRKHVSDLAEVRLKAGDATPQEAATARIDYLQAQQDAVRAGYDIPISEERLRNLLALGEKRCPLVLDTTLPTQNGGMDPCALAKEAAATRPDAVAAIAAVAAAEERLRLAKLAWFRVLGIGDATSANTPTDHVFGPGLRFTVPIFNQGQGMISRAKAEAERACRQQQTVHNQIVLDVYRAYAQYLQARSEIEVLQQKVRPEVLGNIRRSQKAYQEGNAPYLIVLEATRQLVDSFLREAQLHADLRRTWAELERSVGRHLETPEKKPDPRQGGQKDSILDVKPDAQPDAKEGPELPNDAPPKKEESQS